LSGYGSVPFVLDEDFNIVQGLVRTAGEGKIVRRDRISAQRRRLMIGAGSNSRMGEASE